VSGMILFIIANASMFAYFLTFKNVPQMLTDFVVNMHLSKVMFLIAVNIILLIVGNFMEPSSIIMIMVLLLLHITKVLGIDPYSFWGCCHYKYGTWNVNFSCWIKFICCKGYYRREYKRSCKISNAVVFSFTFWSYFDYIYFSKYYAKTDQEI